LDELKESRVRIVSAADDERRKLQRDLHDGVQQKLVAAQINLMLAGERAGDPPLHDRLDRVRDILEEATGDLRELVHGLYPPGLRERGLVAALEHMAGRLHMPVLVSAPALDELPADVKVTVFYCCSEAIQNATKHGGSAVQISVAVRIDADRLVFEVADDGPGFDPSAGHAGTGLLNMRDRVAALDGQLSIVSSPGQGSVVSGSIPVRPTAAGARPKAA
jgi:signal transduction histidine kinase